MWGAIKSDLFEFISTVQDDAQVTLSKVVDITAPRSSDDEEKITEDERILSEFRNNLTTYSEDVESEQLPEFEKFLKSFSLSSKAEEIEYILELENGITKHYETLVPTQIRPELFWARYFFKVNILIISSLDSMLESAYEEEEELTWGEEEGDNEDKDDDDEDEDKNDDNDNDDDDNDDVHGDAQESTDRSNDNLPTRSDASARKEDAISTKIKVKLATNTRDEVADEVALLAARNITQLQEANTNLSTRAAMLEGEVEKLQNQMIKERTVSAKLRTSLTQGEEREKKLTTEVEALQLKLAVAEREAKERADVALSSLSTISVSEAAPLSNCSSSIVDLGSEQTPPPSQSHTPPPAHSSSGAGASDKNRPPDQLGPSVSDLSLASLQSVSSVSSSSPSCSEEEHTTLSPVKSPVVTVLAANISDEKEDLDVKEGPGGDVDADDKDKDEDEEEEWDNEAWE